MFAIIGVAAQLPSGQHSTEDFNHEEFWDFLLKGGQAFEYLKELKMHPDLFAFADLFKLPQKGAFLKNMSEFDYSAFGLSKVDARAMSNSARRLMELSFDALRDAGIQTRGQAVGCFMSGSNDLDLDTMNADGTLAYIPSAIANRISYAFNLTGPSMAIDTACSSSLTSLHLAMSAIKNGDCTAALVGAAQSNRKIAEWRRYDKAGLLSPSGVCKPFDDRADGLARGEGAIVVVVKSLQEALKDKDHIYCVVASSFHGATGSGAPVYVPNGAAQQFCISRVYSRAERDPMEADYVELHMTGTKVGDPIEAGAAGQIFCKGNATVRVGSVKGNIGHLECASFLASLVKVCHIFDKGIIPPTPGISLPNRAIPWDKYNLEVVTKPVPLSSKTKARAPLISIASAGIGGSLGHVLLEGPPRQESDMALRPECGTPVLFLIGGLTPNAVQDIAQQLTHLPSDYQTILDNAVTSSRQARQLPWRSYLIYKNDRVYVTDLPRPILSPTKIPQLAFVFSGQGPHNAQMGHQLFQQYPVFRNTVLELDDIHQKVMGYSFLKATGLFSREITDSRVLQRKWPVILTLPALVMVHIGIFELLKSMGVVPDYLLGHSAGETALVYVSGAGPKSMAMEIALARGLSMTCTESMDGAMAVVACNAGDCRALIDRVHLEHGVESDVEISCFNAPDSVVVSGNKDLVEAVIALARDRGTFAQVIHTLVPGHCKYIEHCRGEHYRLMQDIFSRYPGPHIPTVPVFSTCRPGEMVEEFTPDYFWDNARNPVYFSNAISRILARSDSSTVMFVEISPHPVLSGTVAAHGIPATRIICPMQRFPRDSVDPHHETICLLNSVADLAMAGYDRLDFSGFYGIPKHRKPIFNHPLRRLQVPPCKTFATTSSNNASPLLSSLPGLDISTANLFSQHRVGDTPVIPGTAWLEVALEAGGRYLWDIEFQALVAIKQNQQPKLFFEREGRNKWTISSTQQSDPHAPSRTIVAVGCLGMNSSYQPSTERLDVMALSARLDTIPLEGIHEAFGDHFSYGPSFVRLGNLYGNPSEILAEIRGPDEEELFAGYILHPAILDACTRVVAYKEVLQDWETNPWFPKSIGRFIPHARSDTSTNWFSYARLNRWAPDSRSYDILVTNSHGDPICEFKDFKLQKASSEITLAQRKALMLTTEPLGIPIAAGSGSGFFRSQDREAYERLYRVLDQLALNRIRKTLCNRPTCGDSIDRARYLKRISDITESEGTSRIYEDSEIREQEVRWPAFFEVTRRIDEVHESVLKSSQVAVSALYADDLMSRYYVEHNRLTKACEEMAQQLDEILKTLHTAGKRVVRILEIGAGTGTLTRCLTPILDNHGKLAIEYTVTDVSYSLVADLVQSLQFEGFIPKAYDATRDPFLQGFSTESFDIIIAYHVLHVAPDLHSLGQQLNDMLVPGGFLLATEVDNTSWSSKPGTIWMDFVFGSFAEWFNYQDHRDHCSMTPGQWNSLLQSTGFINFSSIVGSGNCLDFIIIGQKAVTGGKAAGPPPAFTLFHYRVGLEMEIKQFFTASNPALDAPLCLWTDNKYDGDSAIGLVVTLVKEFTTRTTWLAMFSDYVDPSKVEAIIKQNHAHLAREHLVHFLADGTPLFPRVVRLPPVSSVPETQDLSYLPKDHLLVQIVDRNSEGAFMGRVIRSDNPDVPEEAYVVGLHAGVVAKDFLITHAGRTTKLLHPDRRVLQYLPAILLQYHILGVSRFMYPVHDHPPLKVLIALRDAGLRESVQHLLELSPGVIVLAEAGASLVDVVVTDHSSLETNPLLELSVGKNGRLIVWSSQLLEETVSQEAWILRYILSAGIRSLNLHPINGIPSLESKAVMLPDGLTRRAFFEPNKAYVLIGGIGGIGLHLAVWLYKNGARHIYLTSRRGRATIAQAHETLLQYKLQYLESQKDLDLRLVACDASNVDETAAFLKTIRLSIGGCFLMPLVLRDALFLQQTEDSFDLVRRSKVDAFDTISRLYDVKAMDFFVAFSSVTALWGNVGQSNYASACSALGGKISQYPNAFALLVPAILDTGYLVQANALDRLNLQGAYEWGISAEELCEYIRDGITRVKSGNNPSVYIPELDLGTVTKHISLPPMYRALIPRSSTSRRKGHATITQKRPDANDDIENILKSAREIVMSALGIEDETAFSTDVPFVNCGLDSIRATRLSRQLKPYIEVPQTDLLLGMAWNDLKRRIEQKYVKRREYFEVIETCQRLVLSALGMESVNDLSHDIPFVNSGLDSIRATQLSRQLKPYIHVSHMDLLLGMCWRDLEERIRQPSLQVNQHDDSLGVGVIEQCRNLVMESLDIDPTNFDPDIPFTNCGLDSIRATRLSRRLKSYVEISQMDLLLGMTWKDLEKRINDSLATESSTPAVITRAAQKERQRVVSFTKLDEATGDGPVVLALPGITGALSTIHPLMNHATKGAATIWATQIDLSSCSNSPPSLEELAKEVHNGIRERCPSGALRIVAVSGSSTLAFLLAEALESEKRHVLNISFLDHFPALFCHDVYGVEEFVASPEESPEMLRALDSVAERGVEVMLRLQEIDPTTSKQQSKWDDAPRVDAVRSLETARLMVAITVKFLKDLYYHSRMLPSDTYEDTLVKWMGSVKAPLLIVVADQGFNRAVEAPWTDMGAGRLLPYKNNVEVWHIDQGHFAVVGCEELARKLGFCSNH